MSPHFKIPRPEAFQLGGAAILGVAYVAGGGTLAAMAGAVLNGMIPNFLHSGISNIFDKSHSRALEAKNHFVQRAIFRTLTRCAADTQRRWLHPEPVGRLTAALEADGARFEIGVQEIDEARLTELLSGKIEDIRARQPLTSEQWLHFLRDAEHNLDPTMAMSQRCSESDLEVWADDLAKHFTTQLFNQLRDMGAAGDPAAFTVVLRFLGEIHGEVKGLQAGVADSVKASVDAAFNQHLLPLKAEIDRLKENSPDKLQWALIDDSLNELVRTLGETTETLGEHAETIGEHIQTMDKQAGTMGEHVGAIGEHIQTMDEQAGTMGEISERLIKVLAEPPLPNLPAHNTELLNRTRGEVSPIEAVHLLDEIQREVEGCEESLKHHWIRWREADKAQSSHMARILDRIDGLEAKIGELSAAREGLRLLTSTEFGVAQEVLEYLALDGWKPTKAPWDSPLDYVVCLSVRRQVNGRLQNRRICCTSEDSDLELVEGLAAMGETPVWIFCEGSVDSLARERALELDSVAKSLDELILEALSIKPYVRWLEERLADERVLEHYVDLRSSRPNRHDNGRSFFSEFEKEAREWANKSRRRKQFAVLGDFGIGKSWFALKFARDRLIEFLDRGRRRLPLLIRLRDFPGLTSLEDLLLRFRERFDTPIGEPEVFRWLLRSKRLLLIFDGLDELTLDVDASPMERLSLIAEAIVPGSKVLLTSRKTFFAGIEQQRDLLLREKFQWYEIEEMETDQILEFLERRKVDAKRFMGKIRATYDLPDLARRPILLEIIIQTWEELPDEQVEVGDLYRIYTDRWIHDVGAGRPVKLDATARRELMVRTAVEMFRPPRQDRIEASRLHELIATSVQTLGVEVDPALEEEIECQAYLIRDSDDRYFFAHRSFMEYFVAGHVADEIESGRPDILKEQLLEPELIDFVSAYALGEEPVWKLLHESLAGDNLPRLNGNLLSVLRDLNADFRNRKLAGLHAGEADLPGADLSGTDLSGSELDGWNVRNVCLKDTNFEGAVLRNWNLGVRSSGKGVRFLPGSRDVVTGTSTNAVVVLNSSSDEWKTLQVHDDSVTSVDLAAAGRFIVSGGFDRFMRVWDVKEERPMRPNDHRKIVYGVAVSPDERYVASSDKNGRVRIWDPKTEDAVFEWQAHKGTAYTVDWSPSSDAGRAVLGTGGFDSRVGLSVLDLHPSVSLIEMTHLDGHSDLVNGVRFSPDGKYLASTSNDGNVIVWDVELRTAAHTLRGHESIVWTVAFSPDGRRLFSGSSDTTIRVWNWRTETEVQVLRGHQAEVWNVDVDDSGNYVASGSLDGTVRLWELASGDAVRTWKVDDEGQDDRQAEGDQRRPLDATGMNIRGVQSMSDLQRRILKAKGAKD